MRYSTSIGIFFVISAVNNLKVMSNSKLQIIITRKYSRPMNWVTIRKGHVHKQKKNFRHALHFCRSDHGRKWQGDVGQSNHRLDKRRPVK